MSTGKWNREKGAILEREVREAMSKLFGEVRKYRQSSSNDTDLPDVGTDGPEMPFDIECKNRKVIKVLDYMRQAEKRCREGKKPVVWARLLKLGPGKDDYVIMRPDTFLWLCRAYCLSEFNK